MQAGADIPSFSRIFQSRLPFDVTPRPLPGIRPADPDDWLMVDDAFADQIAYRTHLITTRRDIVHVLTETARPAAEELLQLALDTLNRHPDRGYRIAGETVTRPDGETVRIDRDDPLGTLAQLVQEDLCILEKQGDEHVLTGAILCFPASWSLAEKFKRPLTRIHDPVPSYDDQIARRVQRLFDGVQTGRPLWRFNRLWYARPDLHQPRKRTDPPREKPGSEGPRYFRSEKQVIFRLPESKAVVFSIHTFVLPEGVVPEGAEAG
ncbi:heme-dependent oxidative N-demethylase family protein [Aestuariivita boseongensis]|uniref:heme-dependent oxidative N-demethylase family protein n=1 Tax=Aestuariivita boseongensis TaxID=1470562 RepID=UPI0006815D58|nr:DUF3445 domain-containing protein [Aestuariivita boseongensis]